MKKRKFKVIIASLCISMMGIGFLGCGGSASKEEAKISVSGSTSVAPLMEKIAEEYQKENEGVTIEINQNGSSAGIKDATSGVSDIGMSSRDLKDEEKKDVDENVIAYDGIAVITNSSNKIKNLTKEQIKNIFTGKITNWSEVGGDNKEIVVVSREEGSGTRTAFQEILGYESGELISTAQIASGSGDIKTAVVGNENAIGYVSFEYLDSSINAVSVEGVEPKGDNVKNKTYSLSRGFLLVNKKGEISEEAKKLVDWILSDKGQEFVENNGAIKVK